MSDEHWIRTDEAEDVAASLRQALRCLKIAQDDEQAWKWVLLALHSALQGACVCHLLTTATPIGIVTKKNEKEWFVYLETSRTNSSAKRPETRIMSLPELLKAIRKPHSAGDRSNDFGVTLSDNELDWLKRIHTSLRNQFVHFEPMGWSIEVSGIRDLAHVIARIIGEIADIGWAFRHKNKSWHASLTEALNALNSA
jgi:hypothetical protein